MFPQFEIYWITIYSFGLALSLSFILFFWMLYKLSLKFWINSNFFLNSIFFYFISMFFFSRLFFVISEWKDYKFQFFKNYFSFFFMPDYNLSLIWWIFWLFLVLYFKIKKFKLNTPKYIDAIVLAFFFAAIIWYLWTFFGWQIIWKPTSLPIWITYTDAFSKSPYSWPIFPLGLMYAIFTFMLFVWLYITRIFIKIEWFIGYLWITIFASLILIFEFFNGNPDIFNSYLFLNLNQFSAIWLILYWVRWFKKIYALEQK